MAGEHSLLRDEIHAMRRVRLRILVAFLVLGVLAMVGAGLVIYQLATGTRGPFEEARRAEEKVLHTAEVARNGTAIAALLYQHAVAPLPPAELDDLRHRLVATADHMAAVEQLLVPAEVATYRRAEALFERFDAAANQAITVGRRGDQAEVGRILQQQLLPVLAEARVIADDMIQRNRAEANRLLHESNERMRFVLGAAAAATGLFILVVAAAGFYTMRIVGKQQERLREQMDQVGQALRDLDAFAGRIAHDIRGPLAPILLASQQLLSTHDRALQERAAQRILRSARRADSLIESLLAFSRAGQARPGGRCVAAQAIASAVEESRDAAAEADIETIVDVEAREVAIEEPLLAQAMQNLLSNAVRYMPPEQPVRRIHVRTRPVRGCLRIEVADTGPGIPPEERDQVFRPFYRSQRHSDEAAGTGLGLATVRRLIEAHGGAVGIEDNPGGGSVVWLLIPFAPPAAEARPAPVRSAPAPAKA